MRDKRYEYILCRFGELSTKGRNRKDFIKCLLNNIKRRLSDFEGLSFRSTHDAIYITLNDNDYDEVAKRLKTVYGLSNFFGAIRCDRDIESIKRAALSLTDREDIKTFKVNARRSDKTFPMVSDEINRAVAGAILANTNLKVDVHNPGMVIYIIVKEDRVYVLDHKEMAIGGYPVGINGKCLVMMSGGIDSPVAASMMMKRGLKVECIHFASMPYTSKQALDKVKTLVKILTAYQSEITLHIVPFTDLQLAIYEHVDEPYAITILRRMMYRIADALAKDRNIKVLANGESLGQVASQTPESLTVISEVADTLIIRPLACLDKIEIIDMAKELGTYETSILPYEDCCTIFAPKDPVTKPHQDKCQYFENRFDYAPLIEDCLKGIETIVIRDTIDEEDDIF